MTTEKSKKEIRSQNLVRPIVSYPTIKISLLEVSLFFINPPPIYFTTISACGLLVSEFTPNISLYHFIHIYFQPWESVTQQ
ncbi:hypothetical protein ACET3Z_013809 [Daucus carota]